MAEMFSVELVKGIEDVDVYLAATKCVALIVDDEVADTYERKESLTSVNALVRQQTLIENMRKV